jgi:hypothetical protein
MTAEGAPVGFRRSLAVHGRPASLAARVARLALVGGAFVLAPSLAGCEPEPAAYALPKGPPQSIGLAVAFYVDVVGTWAIDGFRESLAERLADYDVHVVARDARPETVAVIDLGAWTDRVGGGRMLRVTLVRGDTSRSAGTVQVPDLTETTLYAAARPVAFLIARTLLTQRTPLAPLTSASPHPSVAPAPP